MADVDITSLSVEISAESQGAELNIDKLATAISNLRTKGNVSKVCSSLDTLAKSISALKSSSSGINGLSRINDFMDRISKVNLSESAKGIRSVASALTRVSSVDLKGIDLSGLKSKMNGLQKGLSPLSKVDASSLRSVSSALNSIAKIPDFSSKLDSKTLNDFATSCKKITDALDPLASKIETVGNSFAKLPSNIQKVIAATDGTTKANSKSAKSYFSLSNQLNGFMRNMAKLVSLKAIAEYLGNAAAKFNDFYEATDMFTVSMGEMTESANQFINKMESLLGIDPTEAMNNMANVYSMVHSFGMASDKAYTLSQNLTQLGYDLASLKNMNPSETFTKLRSAMAGELEPVLQLGVDISQARLKQELLELGFNKQISTLSQADKATLRYIAIMKQLTYVQGNLGETLSSPANMIRMLKAQLNNLARDIGSLLYPALKSILPPLIAAVELVREFVQWVAKLMGVEVTFTDFSKNAGSVGEIGDAMDDTANSTKKAAKALKDYTMGFDELNIIDPNKGSKSDSSGGATGNLLGGVDLSSYDMFSKYDEGFGKQIDAIKQKIKDMLPFIGAVSAALALWKITNFLTDIATAISKMTELQKLALSIATVVVEASLVFSFAKGYASSGNPLELLGEVVSAAFGSFVLWRTMGADGITLGVGIAFVASLAGLTYALGTGEANLGDASTWIQAALTTAFGSITGITLLTNLGVASGTAATLSIGLAGLITFAGITFSLGEKLKEFPVLDTIISALMGIFGGVAGAGVALLVGASLPVAGAVAAVGVGIGLVLHWAGIKWGTKESGEKTDATAEADIKMHYVENVFEQRIEAIKQIIVTKWNAAIDFMTSLPGKVGNIINSIGEWFNSLPEKIGYALGFAVGKIGEWVGNMVTTVTTEVPKIVSSVVKFFEELPENILTAILKTVDTISEWRERMVAFVVVEVPKIISSIVGEFKKIPVELRKLGKFIWDGLINGLKDAWSTVTNGIKSFTDGFINGFKDALGIHSPSTVFAEIGGYIDQGLANGIAAAIPYVATAMQGVVDAVQEKGQALIDAGSAHATGYVNNFLDSLDTEWQHIDQSLQSDFFGSINTLWEAISNGDLEKLGTWAASYFYHAMDDEQRKQIKSIANNSLQWLTQGLSSVWNNIAGMASSFISQFVPSAVAATSAQTSLNVAMDANPVMLVISLIGMLVGALVNFANKNKSVSTFLQNIWYGVGDFFSIIFEGILRVIGTAVQGFVDAINSLIWAWNKVPLHKKMDYVSNPMYDWADKVANDRKESQRKRQEAANSSFDDSKDKTDYEQLYRDLLKKQQEDADALKKKYNIPIPSYTPPNYPSYTPSTPNYPSYNPSDYPGTKEWDKNNGTSSGSYGGTTSVNVNINEEEMRESVYNGTYNAFLDIFQRYGDELTGGKELKIYLDGKQITASVERRQNARGQSLMGSEVYSY